MVTGKLVMGGLETHMYDLCTGLLRRGHHVSLHAPFVEARLQRRLMRSGVTLTVRPELDEFDVIHAHPWTWGLLRGLELSILMDKPLVATYHGRYRIVWDDLCRHGAQVVAVSPEVRSFLGHGIVIENGIDVDRFGPKESNLPQESFVICFVGRLGGERWRAIEVLAELSDTLGLHFHVVGDQESLWRKPTTGIQNIVWHGSLEDIRPVLRTSHLVFTTGRGIREAMASGRPVAVLNSSEYDGLVTPANIDKLRQYNFSGRATRRKPVPELLATDIKRLIHEREYWRHLATWGRKYAEKHFDLETMISKHEEIYRNVVMTVSK